jgi:type IV pilus assembly protein PilX
MSHGRIHRRGVPVSVRHQQGVVMFVALVVLIVMTLAGLAMLRQMGGAVSIAGNVAFKQSATAVADAGTEAGRAWIVNPVNNRDLDAAASGYFSSWGASVNPDTFNWGAAPVAVAANASGFTVRYVIHRLCAIPNLSSTGPGQQCSEEKGKEIIDKGTGDHWPGIPQPYFRVTTRVEGPRNTVSYTQVVTN